MRGPLLNNRPLLLALFLLLIPGAQGRAETKVDIRVGVSTVGSGWAGPAAVKAASTPMVETLSRKHGLSYSLVSFPSPKKLSQEMKAGQIEIGSTTSMEYIKMAETIKLVPLAIKQIADKTTFKLLLLVHRSSGIKELSQLKGKSISIYNRDPIHQEYLDVILGREGLKGAGSFFSTIKQRKKAKSTVLDVFFKQTDACIVSEMVFSISAELNPQLKKRLNILTTSKPFANDILFAISGLPQDHMERIKKALVGIHEEPEGKQLMLISRAQRYVLAKDADLSSLRELWQAYKKLKPQGP